MILKNFAVFEGIDGAGTSTQIQLLKKREECKNFFFTAEPTSFPTGKFLRQMLKDDITLNPKTSAFLFAADRAEHVWGKSSENGGFMGIEEACLNNKITVSDRYIFSSLAYQKVTCGKELPAALNSFFPLPELLFFFEIEPEDSLKRISGRETIEIYEKSDFLKETEKAYREVINEYEKSVPQMKIIRIDAAQPKDVIAEKIWNELKKLL